MPTTENVGAPVLLAQEEVRSTPPGGGNSKSNGWSGINTKNTVFGHFDMFSVVGIIYG